MQEIKHGKLKEYAKNNRLIVDGAHNIGSSKVLSKWVESLNENVHLILGMMKDKDHLGFLKNFKNKVKSITLIDIPNQTGSIAKEELKLKVKSEFSNIEIANSIEESLKYNSNSSSDIILITGSLYLAGEVLNLN